MLAWKDLAVKEFYGKDVLYLLAKAPENPNPGKSNGETRAAPPKGKTHLYIYVCKYNIHKTR